MAFAGRAVYSARLIGHFSTRTQPFHPSILNKPALSQKTRSQLRAPQRRPQSGYAGQYADPNASYTHQEPPRKPLFYRILSGTLRYGLAAAGFTCVGFAIGYATLPNLPVVQASLRKRPSDAETLSLYTPPDSDTAAIDAHIVRHALSESLRRDPSMRESRPHLKIPEPIRSTNLTGGTLAGPGMIAVPPLTFADKEGRSAVTILYLGEQLCGHPGIVHGGLLATLLDEGLARCCFPALPNQIGVTANLRLDYRKPVKAGRYYVLRAQTERVEGRKAWVRGWIEELADEADGDSQRPEGQGKTKLVEAEALFIEPKNAQFMKRIYSPE